MSHRSATANQTVHDSIAQPVIAHALRLFGERGYASTPVSAIAAAAGVSPRAALRLLSRQDRTRGRDLRGEPSRRARLVGRADAEPDPRRRVAALLHAVRDLIRERRDFWALSYGVRMQREVLASLAPSLDSWTRDIHERLQRYLEDAGWRDARLESLLLFAHIDGVSQHYVLDPGRYPLDAVIDRLIQRYQPAAAKARRPLRKRPSRRTRAGRSS